MYNQHTRGMVTTRHRSLFKRGGRKALLETLHTPKKQCQKKPKFTNLKDSSTSSFQQSYWTISYEVITATSIKIETQLEKYVLIFYRHTEA